MAADAIQPHPSVEPGHDADNLLRREATAIDQQKAIKALTASLREQASQIQKVSAQLEVNKPAPQMVINNP